MKKTQLWLLPFLWLSALFVGCGTKAVYVTVTRPAEVNLKDFDKIAIGEIKGSGSDAVSAIADILTVTAGGTTKNEGSRAFSEELMQALFESERFEVLDHESLKMSLNQNDLVMSSLTDGGNAEEIRKIFGNLALIQGSVSNYSYDEDVSREDSEHKDKETGKVTTTRTYSRSGTASVSVNLRVVDLRTSKILANKNFTASRATTKSSKNSSPPFINRDPLFAACREQIIRSFVRMIAPYTERVQVYFATAKEIPELEQGFNMAKLGNWDAAIDIFQEVTRAYSSSPVVHKAYYNLGLGYMYSDRFDEARAALEEAYASKPDRKYKMAIDELDVRIEDKRRLEEQRRVGPEAAEGDRAPMEEQGQPDAAESDGEPMEMQGQSEAEGAGTTPMKDQR